MDKTYNEGYRDGFKEGFKDGYEAAKKELEKKSEDDWSSPSAFGGGFGGFGGNPGFGFNSGFGNGVTPPEFPKEKKSITKKFKEIFGAKGKDDYDPARDNIVDEYGCFDPGVPLMGFPDEALGGEDQPWPDEREIDGDIICVQDLPDYDPARDNITFEYGAFDDDSDGVVLAGEMSSDYFENPEGFVKGDKKDEDKKSEE